MSASNPLAQILDINRLIEIDYIDWLINLKIIFNFKKLNNILYQIILMLTTCPIHSQRAIYLMSGWIMIIKMVAMHEYMFTVNEMLIHLQVL